MYLYITMVHGLFRRDWDNQTAGDLSPCDFITIYQINQFWVEVMYKCDIIWKYRMWLHIYALALIAD